MLDVGLEYHRRHQDQVLYMLVGQESIPGTGEDQFCLGVQHLLEPLFDGK